MKRCVQTSKQCALLFGPVHHSLPNDELKVAGGPFATRRGVHLAGALVHDFDPYNQTRAPVRDREVSVGEDDDGNRSAHITCPDHLKLAARHGESPVGTHKLVPFPCCFQARASERNLATQHSADGIRCWV
jgi:hypothetical protein